MTRLPARRLRTARHRRRASAAADSDASAAPSPADRHRFWTWPKKIGTAVLSLVVAWAVPFFAPGVWNAVKGAGGREPLAVTVLGADQFQSPAHTDHDDEMVVPRPLSEVQRAWNGGSPREYRVWARREGGVDATSTLVRLVVRGTSSKRVLIQRIEVDVTRRDPPASGLRVTRATGGTKTVHYLRADLETGRITWSDGDGSPVGPLTLWVSDSEEEVVDLIAVTRASDRLGKKGCDCRWLVNVTYTVAGEAQPRTKTVRPPGGGEFRTTDTTRAAAWNLDDGTCGDVPGLPRWCDG
jgi:hypothetical protein